MARHPKFIYPRPGPKTQLAMILLAVFCFAFMGFFGYAMGLRDGQVHERNRVNREGDK